MVRPAVLLYVRFLLALALAVATLPLRAVAPTCLPTHAKAVATPCRMMCCAGKAMAKPMACHAPVAQSRLATKACDCDLKPAPSLPAQREPTPVAVALVTLPAPPALAALEPLPVVEPGLRASDSGPPPRTARPPDLGRAPPVSRA